MTLNLFKRYFMFGIVMAGLTVVPGSCSSEDEGTTDPTTGNLETSTTGQPTLKADPTNENTTISATGSTLVDGVSTSTVTFQLADANGKKLKNSGGVVAVTTTGDATVGETVDNGDGTYTVVITNSKEQNVVVSGTVDGVAITNTISIVFNPDNSNPAQEVPQSTESLGPSLLRINCGGPEVTYDGITFIADAYFEAEGTIKFSNPFVTEIAETEMDDIYLTERITADDANIRGPFSYNIPVTNGMYSVRLHFAEIYWGVENPQGFEGDEGKRIFSTTIEDVAVFTGYDLVKDINPAIADQRMYDVEVTDEMLTITFEASVNKPKISAIEILGSGSIILE